MNKKYKILIIALIIIIVGLMVYIVVDKLGNKTTKDNPTKEETTITEPNKEETPDFEGYWISKERTMFIFTGTTITVSVYATDDSERCDIKEIEKLNDKTFVIKRTNCFYGVEQTPDNEAIDLTITYDAENNTITHKTSTYYLIANNDSEFEDFDDNWYDSGMEFIDYIKSQIKTTK